MKVVLAHKFLRLVGGTEIYFRNLAEILEQAGHQVMPFAVADQRNPPSAYAKYFLAPLDLRDKPAGYKLRHIGRILSRTLYSPEARRRIGRMVEEQRPDIAHLQCIENHISPSIIDELRARGVPMVQSVNTYKHLCASYRLYLADRQRVCEACSGGRHYHALRNRCVKGSLFASALGCAEMYLHQSWLKIYHGIDRFIVPNRFLEQKMLQAGYPQEKLVRMRNPFELGAIEPTYGAGDFILYFGRIEPEKGVYPLIEALERLPEQRLVVVGDGLDRARCERLVAARGLRNVEFTGPKWGGDLAPYLAACRLVVVPSLWYEPSPYVIYQALAQGKPVVASRIGGIPDLITDQTGRLAEPGDVDDLAAKLREVSDHPEREAMGRAARAWAERALSPARYYERIMEVYEAAAGRCLR